VIRRLVGSLGHRKIGGGCASGDIDIAGAVDSQPARLVSTLVEEGGHHVDDASAPTQVGGVDQRRAGRVQLGDERVGAFVRRGVVRYLVGPRGYRKVGGECLASHNHVARQIHGNRVAYIAHVIDIDSAAAPAQVRRVDQRRAGWIQLGDECVGIILRRAVVRCLVGSRGYRKSVEYVSPATYASPVASTAIALPLSPEEGVNAERPLPPR